MDRRVQEMAYSSLWIVLLKDNARSLRPLRGRDTIHTRRTWTGPHAQVVARPIRRRLGRTSSFCAECHGLVVLAGSSHGRACRHTRPWKVFRPTTRTGHDKCVCSSLLQAPNGDSYQYVWFWELASFL